MFRTVLFICLSCLIASHAFDLPGIDPEQREAAIKTGTLIWQIFNTERRLSNITTYKHHETIHDLYGSVVENFNGIPNFFGFTSTKKERIVLLKSNMYKFYEAVEKIDDRYNEYLVLSNPEKENDIKTIEDFAKSNLKDNKGVNKIVEEFHTNLVGSDYASLIHLLSTTYEDINPFCVSSKTKQRFFYHLLFSAMGYYHKCYEMLLFSNKIFRDYLNYHDYDDRLATLKHNTEERIKETIEKMKPIIAEASRDMHRCDLQKHHKEDETYTYLKNLFTRLFQYTDEIVRKQSKPGCPGFCPSGEDILGVKCNGECQIKQRPCNHYVKCSHAGEHDLCLEANQNSIRRYASVKDHYSFWYKLWHHPPSDCADKIVILGGNACNTAGVCNCVCDESENSDRYFSLDDVRAKVKSNYVVTGVKLVKKNGIVKIQIQEGKLLPFAFIDQQTVNWTSTGEHESYSIYDAAGNVKNVTDDFQLLNDDRRRHNVTWNTGRGIFLSDVEAPKEEVVTGVRFSTEHIGEKAFLKIEIESTRYNFTTGQLNLTTSQWRSHSVKEFQQNLFKLDEYDAPVNVDNSHLSGVLVNSITYFTPTSIISQDTGSSVVPYLDIQPLNSNIAVPLSAMGFGLMSGQKSGGYLVLTAKSFDVSPYMSLF